MTLDDIDWEGAHLMVRGKGGQRVQLAVVAEVGHAIAAYLRKDDRAAQATAVPSRACAAGGLCQLFRCLNACPTRLGRCGSGHSPHTGAYVFRHSLATEMLRQGASLGEIGSCCVMHIRTRPRFMRRLMSAPCVRWRCVGREVGDEIVKIRPRITFGCGGFWALRCGTRSGA